MDKEIVEILKSMQNDMKSMKSDISSINDRVGNIENNVSELNDRVTNIENNVSELNSRVTNIENQVSELNDKVDNVENKTDRNTLLLEDINKKVEVVGEVQSAFAEQLDRAKSKDNKSLGERLNIIELAVTDTSSRVKDVQKDLAKVARATGENWAEIIELKAVK